MRTLALAATMAACTTVNESYYTPAFLDGTPDAVAVADALAPDSSDAAESEDAELEDVPVAAVDAPESADTATPPDVGPCGPCPVNWQCITDDVPGAPFCGCSVCKDSSEPYRCNMIGTCVRESRPIPETKMEVAVFNGDVLGMYPAVLDFPEDYDPGASSTFYLPYPGPFKTHADAKAHCETLTIGGSFWKWRAAGAAAIARLAGAACPEIARCDGQWGDADANAEHCPDQDTSCWPFADYPIITWWFWSEAYWYQLAPQGRVKEPPKLESSGAGVICFGGFDYNAAKRAAGIPVE